MPSQGPTDARSNRGLIVVIDTAGTIGGVGSFEDPTSDPSGRPSGSDAERVAHATFPAHTAHATSLVSTLDNLLSGMGRGPGDVSCVGVALGPGSFTGLRVGLTFAKTFAFATGCRLAGVPTSRVLVEDTPPDVTNALVVLDARRRGLFVTAYARDDAGVWGERKPLRLISSTDPDVLSEAVTTVAGSGMVVGIAAERLDLLGVRVPTNWSIVPNDDRNDRGETPVPRLATLARLTARRVAAGAFDDPDTLTPLYGRASEPEERRAANEREAKASASAVPGDGR